MKRSVRDIAAALLFCGFAMIARDAAATGTSAAQFLKLGAGARASAMGDAAVSVTDDVTAGYWNPAGLARIASPEVAAMQNTHLVDTQYQYAAAAMPAASSVFAVSLYRMDYGSIDRYNNSNVRDGSFNAGSQAAALSVGRAMNDDLALGISLKYVSESIESEKASSFAADLGATYRYGTINFAAAIQHLGPAMKMVSESAPLPMTVRLGASMRLMGERLLVALEASKPNDANTTLHAGAEFRLTEKVLVRGGYLLTPGQSADLGGLVGLNAGLGITFNRFNLDYSVAPFGDLGLSHHFSVGYKFGPSK